MVVSYTAFGQEEEEKENKVKREFFEKQAKEAEKTRAEERARSSERARESHRESSRVSPHVKYVYPAQPAQPAQSAFSYSSGEDVYIMSGSGSGSSSSQLSLSKSFDGQSSENDGAFDVDETIRYIILQLSGRVEEGEIEMTITQPDGKVLKDLTINNSADVQFSQTIKISEEDKYYGQWGYSVKAKKAKGHYKLSIRTR